MTDELPRVTQILQAVGLGPDYSMVPAATLERARARGTAVHALIEADHYGYLDEADISEDAAPYVAAYRRFLKESGHEPTLSEFRVVHPEWHYCGHPDRVGWLCGRRALLDWKCMDTVALEASAYQLAGYELAWRAMHPAEQLDIVAVVQLKSDGSYRLHEIEVEKVAHVFLAAVTVYRARKDMTR